MFNLDQFGVIKDDKNLVEHTVQTKQKLINGSFQDKI